MLGWGMVCINASRSAIALWACSLALSLPARGDTLPGALAQAYVNNPVINAQRAALRATDEGVGIALSGYRPTIRGQIQDGWAGQAQTTRAPRAASAAVHRPCWWLTPRRGPTIRI